MSKSNTKTPFKVSNKNENEIDVNVLLNDPRSLHKMLNKKQCIEKENLEKVNTIYPNKKKYSDKREFSKTGELLNKGVTALQDVTVKGYDKGRELIENFIKDSKKDGVGGTLRDRGNNIKRIIDEYVKNNEFLQKANKSAKKVNKSLGVDKYLNKEKDYE